MGALPARFRRPRVLIVGCGDVGQRIVRSLPARLRARALARSAESAQRLRALGVLPLAGDLDDPASLARLAGIATHVIHLAPPATGAADARTRALLTALARRGAAPALVYGSASGVYGDCQGAWVDEARPLAPATIKSRARADAEAQVRAFGRALGGRAFILRIAAIHAADRPRGPSATPALALLAGEDVFVNRIHADDLARASVLALWRGQPQRSCNACDGQPMLMGDWLDMLAEQRGQPRPQRIAREQAGQQMAPARLAFMRESRRLLNRRLQQELRLQLRHPGPLPSPELPAP